MKNEHHGIEFDYKSNWKQCVVHLVYSSLCLRVILVKTIF